MTSHTGKAGGRSVNVWRLAGWGVVAGLLLLPAVAMRFTGEVNWTTTDFVWAGAMLIGAGLLIELIMWRVRSTVWRIVGVLAVLAAFMLIWIDAAVGIF